MKALAPASPLGRARGRAAERLAAAHIADLKAAGKYDATAHLSIQGEITENELNADGYTKLLAQLRTACGACL
jgi:hypothetical protein